MEPTGPGAGSQGEVSRATKKEDEEEERRREGEKERKEALLAEVCRANASFHDSHSWRPYARRIGVWQDEHSFYRWQRVCVTSRGLASIAGRDIREPDHIHVRQGRRPAPEPICPLLKPTPWSRQQTILHFFITLRAHLEQELLRLCYNEP